MDKTYFLSLAKYNYWANDIAMGWLDQITDNQWNKKLIGSMDSLAGTCTHVAGAEKIWLERFENRPEPFLTSHFNGSKSELLEIWKLASNNLILYIENLEADELSESFEYKNMKGETLSSIKFEALAHLFNHSTYHRGQIVNYLRTVGFTQVSSTDLITFYRIKENQ
jgi:uncharacterized damage-inducible protein DinB